MRLTLAAALFAACSFSTASLAAPVSPACALLSDDEAAQILGHKATVTDGGAEVMGTSGCAWVDSETYNALMISVVGGESLAGNSADAWYETQKTGMTAAGKVEDVAGVGDKAFVSEMAGAITVIFVKGGKVVTLNATQIAQDKVVEAAKLVAGHV